MKLSRSRLFRVVVLLLALTPAGTAASREQKEGAPSVKSGLVEQTGRNLVLMDVTVTNRQGGPRPGLTVDDFDLYLGNRSWPIYSLDDFCPSLESGAVSGEAAAVPPAFGRAARPVRLPPARPARTEEDQRTGRTASSGAGNAQAERGAAESIPHPAAQQIKVVLYLDFSQLQMAGRARARENALRWVRNSLRPGQEAMIEAYTSRTGLRELSPFDTDAQHLEKVLTEAFDNKEFFEAFPAQFNNRIVECLRCIDVCEQTKPCQMGCVFCCVECQANATAEYLHGKHSLEAFRAFLTHLAQVPGRKALLLLHQNAVLFPGRFYPFPDPDFRIGTHLQLLEQVGAEAMEARAVVYPLQTGVHNLFTLLAGAAVNLSANLADFTGGRYNRSPSDLFSVADEAVNHPPCSYRIGFEPPEKKRSKVYRVRVEVRGRRLPFSYRVQVLTPEDRLARRAEAILRQPESAHDLPLRAALIPLHAAGKKWRMQAELRLDLDQWPALVPGSSAMVDADLGALLLGLNSNQQWQMVTGTTMSRVGSSRRALLYSRIFQDLRPGQYRLLAFVRNRITDQYGGARAEISLPALSAMDQDDDAAPTNVPPAWTGPVAVAPKGRFFPTPLTLKGAKVEPQSASVRLVSGPLPLGSGDARPGEDLDLLSWICPPPPSMGEDWLPYLTSEGRPIYRLPQGRVDPAGDCSRYTVRIETSGLAPGPYVYHLLDLGRPVPGFLAEYAFTIAGPTSGPDR
ncbi:MAG: hypothetical protein ACE5ID_02055 [Acidobacteriota bacterium]